MTTLVLETQFYASIETCFDISRSVDAHIASTSSTKEKAVGGRTYGLCEMGDTITWEATHFGIRQKLTSEITKMDKPHFFEDRMIKGAFKNMRHEHHFEKKNGVTTMLDIFEYEVPYGIFGWIFNQTILKNYMRRFLKTRNQILKQLAESGNSTL
ncbi:MAG: SRPBCC family protein [Flavobacteriales bacterium]